MIIFYSIFIFILGALFTSFYQVIADRIPNHESINGRSYCPSCHHQLRMIDILPIFGYLMNLGKCHFCQERIPISHLIMEMIGGLLFLGSYLVLGFTLEFMASIIMISVLLIESMSDQKYKIVLDRIWMIGIIPIIIIRIIQGDFLIYLLSSLVLFSTLYLLALLGRVIYKKEAFGGGDIKLYLLIGFCLTLQQGLLSLFIASLFGFIYGISRKNKMNHEIALVPFLFIGVLVSYFYGNVMIEWYLNLLGV